MSVHSIKKIGLVAGTSGDSLTKELQKRGFEVILVCGLDNEPGSGFANQVLVSDLGDTSKIVKYFQDNDVQFVAFGTGHYKAIGLIPALEKNGISTNIQYDKFKLVKDKIKFKNFLSENDFPTPKYKTISSKTGLDVLNSLQLPYVVKSSIDVVQPVKVSTLERAVELSNEILERNSEILIEDFVNGSDCTVAVSNYDSSIQDYGVLYYCKSKEYALEGFEGANANKLPASLEKIVCDISRKLISKVGIQGLVRVDFMIDSQGTPYILEVNAVIVTGYNGSAYPFFHSKGIDIAKIMTDTIEAIYEENCSE